MFKRFFQSIHYGWICFFLTILLILISLWGLSIGTVDLPFSVIWHTIIAQISNPQPLSKPGDVPHNIIWLLRLPRILLAIIIGAGLSVCGVIMQAIIKNPLADPYILGISSGASLGATAAILLGFGAFLGAESIGIAAFIGAFSISIAVLLLANIGGKANAIKLLLGGMALSAMCSAFSSFIIYFSNDKEGTQTLAFWLMGSLSGAKWSLLSFIYPLVLLPTAFFLTQSRILNLFLMGDDTAITLGTDLHRYRQIYLLLTSLIVGVLVYAAGMIGFIGLLVPHIIRLFWGTDHQKVLPLSALAGAIFTVIADALSRSLIDDTDIPIGILISLIGAPVFVYLLAKRSYGFGSDK